MMSLAPVVERVLKENASSRLSDLLEKQNRYHDLVKRGIVQEERPKTFGNVAYPIDCKNKHINYSLN
jgi:hypothetical protein